MSLHHGIQVSSSCSDASDRDEEAAVPLDDPYLLKASFMQILKAPVPLALGHFPNSVCLVRTQQISAMNMMSLCSQGPRPRPDQVSTSRKPHIFMLESYTTE